MTLISKHERIAKTLVEFRKLNVGKYLCLANAVTIHTTGWRSEIEVRRRRNEEEEEKTTTYFCLKRAGSFSMETTIEKLEAMVRTFIV